MYFETERLIVPIRIAFGRLQPLQAKGNEKTLNGGKKDQSGKYPCDRRKIWLKERHTGKEKKSFRALHQPGRVKETLAGIVLRKHTGHEKNSH